LHVDPPADLGLAPDCLLTFARRIASGGYKSRRRFG
jgi:hypothetical protein